MSLLLDFPEVDRRLPETERAARLLHPSSSHGLLSQDDLLLIVEALVDGVCLEDELNRSRACAGRYYRRLAHTATFESWLIAWGPSTFLGLHDHGQSSGAFCVAGGTLAEASTNSTTRDPLRTEIIGRGSKRSFNTTHIHELWNPASGTALSVHAYSPPLSSMTFYDHQPKSFLDVLRVETQSEWPDGTE